MAKRKKRRSPKAEAATARFVAFTEQWPDGPDSIPLDHPDRAYFQTVLDAKIEMRLHREKFEAMLTVLLLTLPEKRRQAVFDEIMESMPDDYLLWGWFFEMCHKIDDADSFS